MKRLNGKIELLGGSEEDRRAAEEWLAEFMPNVLTALQLPPGRRTR